MLVVLSLEWQRFSIAPLVEEANNFLQSLTKNLGVSRKVVFNCASLGAGERLLPFAEANNAMPQDDTLDYLRWQHHQVVEALRDDTHFQANRDLLEMLQALKKQGHNLAAVLPSRTDKLEGLLELTRARDFFEDEVFGYDRLPNDLRGNYTLAALYTAAINHQATEFEDSLVVADDPVAIQDAKPIQPLAVIGYLDAYTPEAEQARRLNEMNEAGADYTAVGGYNVAAIPDHLKRRSSKLGMQVIQEARRFH